MGQRKVLICDDDPSIQYFLKLLLVDEGYEVHFAGSCDALSDLVDQHKPHIVLLDLFHGKAVTAFSALRDRSQIPVIVISAYSQDEIESQFGQVHEDKRSNLFILPKPFEVDDLLGLLKKALLPLLLV